MRRHLCAFVLALVYITFVIALSLVLVDVARGSATAASVTGRINVTGTLVYARGLAGGGPGRGGDVTTQSWRITDRYGHRIGRWLVLCRWVLPRARVCEGEITMPLGKLTTAGSSPTPFDAEYAVTGGTGVYRSADGVMLFSATGLRKAVLLITIT